MSEWRKVKLREVLKEVSERNKGEKVKRVLSVTNSQGFVSQEEYFEGTVHSADISNYKIVRKNQFAYNPSRVNVGSIDILKDYEDGALSPMYVIFEVDRAQLLPEYFKYYFQTNRFYANVKNNTQGSVRNSLSFKALSDFDYLLPPIEEQEKIVNLLKKIDSIINKYEKLIGEKNQFIKSQFVGMFGNKEFPYIRFEEYMERCVDVGSNGANAVVMKHYNITDTKDYAMVIRFTNLNSGDFINDVKYLNKEDYEFFSKSKVYGDEIIFCKIGSAGVNYIMPKLDMPVTLGLNQIMITPKNINTKYLYEYINSEEGEEYIKNNIQGAVTKTITKHALWDFPIKTPPIELQNQFAEIVKQIDKQKFLLEQQKQNYENLKKGLMQQLLTGKVRVKI